MVGGQNSGLFVNVPRRGAAFFIDGAEFRLADAYLIRFPPFCHAVSRGIHGKGGRGLPFFDNYPLNITANGGIQRIGTVMDDFYINANVFLRVFIEFDV